MDNLVEADGWQWGTRRMTGVLKDFLSSSTDPAIVKVYKHMQVNKFFFLLYNNVIAVTLMKMIQ